MQDGLIDSCFPALTEEQCSLRCEVSSRGRAVEYSGVIVFEFPDELGSVHMALTIYCHLELAGGDFLAADYCSVGLYICGVFSGKGTFVVDAWICLAMAPARED